MSETANLSLSSFFSRPIAETGKKLRLRLPDQTLTDHWLLVLGKDCDAFVESAKTYRMELVDAKDDKAKETIATNRHLSRLVKAWSFEDEFSQEAVYTLLTQAPHIVEALDEMVYNRKVFFSEAAE